MADTTPDPQQEALFREVDEDLRHEQLHRLWKQYGALIIGAAVLVVAVVAGYEGWHAYKAHTQTADAAAFEQAISKADSAPLDAADALDKVAQSASSGTAALAALQEATLLANNGKVPEALTAYKTLADNPDRDPILRGIATIRYALLGMDNGIESGTLSAMVTPLSVAGKPLEFSARQVLAILAIKDGNMDQAKSQLQSLSQDANCPPGIRSRAKQLLAQIAPDTAGQPAGQSTTPAKDGDDKAS